MVPETVDSQTVLLTVIAKVLSKYVAQCVERRVCAEDDSLLLTPNFCKRSTALDIFYFCSAFLVVVAFLNQVDSLANGSDSRDILLMLNQM